MPRGAAPNIETKALSQNAVGVNPLALRQDPNGNSPVRFTSDTNSEFCNPYVLSFERKGRFHDPVEAVFPLGCDLFITGAGGTPRSAPVCSLFC